LQVRLKPRQPPERASQNKSGLLNRIEESKEE